MGKNFCFHSHVLCREALCLFIIFKKQLRFWEKKTKKRTKKKNINNNVAFVFGMSERRLTASYTVCCVFFPSYRKSHRCSRTSSGIPVLLVRML